MIQLVVYTQGDETPYNLDVSDKANVKLNFKFADPGQPLRRQSPYSGQFTLPFTDTNNQFFGHWYQVDLSTGTFSAETRTRCEVRSQGEIITEGFLQLSNVSLSAESYAVSVQGTAGELYNKLGDKTLKEVLAAQQGDETDYDYTPTATAVTNSWNLTNDITDGSVGAGVVIVPLADYGNTPGGRLFYEQGVADGLAAANYLQGYHLKPAINVTHIVRRMFAYAGVVLDSTFITSQPLNRLYMLLCGTKDTVVRPFSGSQVGITGNIAVANSSSEDITNWSASTAGSYDPAGNWGSFGFSAPAAMTAVFDLSFCFVNGGGSGVAAIYVHVNNQSVVTEWAVPDDSLPSSQVQFTFQASLTLNQGDLVSVTVASAFGFGGFAVAAQPGTFMRFLAYEAVSGGEAVATLDNLPNTKASDFLKELVNRFNLAVVADTEDDRVIKLLPMQDYLGTGETRDWTAKVDRGSNITLSPLTKFRKKNVRFTDGLDKDYFNQWHAEQFGQNLGDTGFTSTDEFATGDLATPMLCGSTAMHPVNRSTTSTGVDLTQVTLPTLYGVGDDGETKQVATKPKLLFYNQLRATGATLYVGSTAFTQYPHLSPFTTTVIGASTWGLYWRHTFTFSSLVIGTEFAQGLYDRFYADYMTQLYDPEARMLECTAVLSGQDVRTLSFADLITIDNQQYRVLDVNGYNPDEVGKATVRLLKDLTAVKLVNPGVTCDLTQVTSNLDGTTGWEDATGATASPTEVCCYAAGLTWYNGNCWWQFPDTGGGGGVNPGDEGPHPPEPYLPPRRRVGGVGPIPIPVMRTTHREIASQPVIAPYADGTNTLQTRNTTGWTTAVHQRYMLMATSSGTTAEVASPRGVLTSTGRGQSMMVLRDGTQAVLQVRCVGTDVASRTGTGVGDHLLVNKLFVVSADGIVRVDEDQTLDEFKPVTRNSPTISLVSVTSTDYGAPANLLEIRVNGGEADRITSWMLDVDVSTVTFRMARHNLAFGILAEDGGPLIAENTQQLITEAG